LRERTLKSGFDFIDFWAVDFDYQDGQPFEHHWQDYRTRKDRSLKTTSDAGFKKYPNAPLAAASRLWEAEQAAQIAFAIQLRRGSRVKSLINEPRIDTNSH